MTHTPPELILGTRASPLALEQARQVAHELSRQGYTTTQLALSTSGDQQLEKPLSESGGKGLFTKEIDDAQLSGKIHIAVHSAKDLPAVLPAGLRISGYLPRESVQDVLLSNQGWTWHDIPHGARLGTCSTRRAALIRHLRPDLVIVPFRGNVGTRLNKMKDGHADATILAAAGLNRLGLLAQLPHHQLDETLFMPAPAQGAIALVTREDDELAHNTCKALNCAETTLALTAERAFLKALGGSCRTPIGALTQRHADQITLHGVILALNGAEKAQAHASGDIKNAAYLGEAVAEQLQRQAPHLMPE